ncbi:hypothetical protein BKA62DRAFT_698018 [Auriculariales sp. MPI-PUGE-AT-0066]|nr:hypothetical protein BKA62DRAFT_698018 [Auriculariales sp. MPI-PUGE-AT-0066]
MSPPLTFIAPRPAIGVNMDSPPLSAPPMSHLQPLQMNAALAQRQSMFGPMSRQHASSMLPHAVGASSAPPHLAMGTRSSVPVSEPPQAANTAAALAYFNYVYYLGVATAAFARQHASSMAGPAPALALPPPHTAQPLLPNSAHNSTHQPRQHGMTQGHTRHNSTFSNASLASASTTTSSTDTLLWDREPADMPRTPDTCSTEFVDGDEDDCNALARLPTCVAETPIDILAAQKDSNVSSNASCPGDGASPSLASQHAPSATSHPDIEPCEAPATRPETPLMARAIREAWWSSAAPGTSSELPWFTLAQHYARSSYHRRAQSFADGNWWESVTQESEREANVRAARAARAASGALLAAPAAPQSTPILPPPMAIQARARRISVPYPGLKINTRVQQFRNSGNGGGGRRRGSNASAGNTKRGRSDSVAHTSSSSLAPART